MPTIESELKFDGEAFSALPDLPGFVRVSEVVLRLEAEYWDTADRRLAAWGVTLRHRRASNDSEDGWTLKLPVLRSGGPGIQRTEVNVAGEPDTPPRQLAELIRAMTLEGQLVGVATLITRRRLLCVGRDSASTVLEVADDHVESFVKGSAGPSFRQVEVEVVGPVRAKAIRKVVAALSSAGFEPSVDRSKLARVLGEPPAGFPRPGRLEPHATVGEFAGMIFMVGVDQLVANDPAVRIGDDDEAVHQARVATRRLRADLRSFGPLLDDERVAALRGELKWLGDLLGGVRDEDVMERNLGALLVTVGGGGSPASGEILDRIGSRRAFRRGLLLSAMSGQRYLRLVQDLMDAAVDPPLRQGRDPKERARPLVRRQARRSWKRVRRAVAALEPEPTDAALHELRKAVKRARYGAQAAGRVGLDTKRFARALGQLQDELGDLHDAVVEQDRLAGDADRLTADAAFVAGQLHQAAEQRRQTSRASWRDRWDDVTAVRPPL